MAVCLLSRKFVFRCGVVIISPKPIDRGSNVRGVMKPSPEVEIMKTPRL